jgi:hypothetical protein
MYDVLFQIVAYVAPILAAFVVIFILLRRKPPQYDAAAMAHMTDQAVLFQTMRDLIREQKELARNFNQSVDRKVAVVRDVIRLMTLEHDNLLHAYHDLSLKLAQAQEDLNRIQGQLSGIGVEPGENLPLPLLFSQNLGGLPPVDTDDFIDTWVGLDFAGLDELGPDSEVVLEPITMAAVDRQEFRSLLSMSEEVAPASTEDGAAPETSTAMAATAEPADAGAAVRAAAFKYYDAGMSVSQIARELGIGKGEVKLMLNLRQNQQKKK